MNFVLESASVLNPKPNTNHVSMPLKKPFMAICPIPSLQFHPLLGTRRCSVSLTADGFSPKSDFLVPSRRNRGIVALAGSHEESFQKHPEIEAEKEKDDLRIGTAEAQEAWKQALDSFKEQALKVQSISQEAYEIYSKKAIVILKDATEQLKIQADKARHDFGVAAKEISEESRVYLSNAADNSPEPVKEIVETFTSSPADLHEISTVRDFHVGIPYGLILSIGGFLTFMVTGSTSAIRFGMILGGTLLALSISSLRSYKRGETFPLALKGQTVIASILFLREISLLSKGASVISYFTTFISGAVVAFFVYKIMMDWKQQRGSSLENETETF